MAPIDFDDFLASEEARRETWRRRFAMEEIFRRRRAQSRPSRGRRAGAARQGCRGHHPEHRRAAPGLRHLADDQVIELHGNTTYATCLDCARATRSPTLRAPSSATATCRAATRCGGFVKTATVSFGQAMPPRRCGAPRARRWPPICSSSLGSSLVVYPAAGFPGAGQAQRRRAGHRQPRADRARPASPIWCCTPTRDRRRRSAPRSGSTA